jgi:hypothetical protein
MCFGFKYDQYTLHFTDIHTDCTQTDSHGFASSSTLRLISFRWDIAVVLYRIVNVNKRSSVWLFIVYIYNSQIDVKVHIKLHTFIVNV